MQLKILKWKYLKAFSYLKVLKPAVMRENERTENKQSTPAENKKVEVKYHANQSTEKKKGGSMGIVAIVVILAIIILGLLFFSDVFA